jgi:protein-histidine pros-kinase
MGEPTESGFLHALSEDSLADAHAFLARTLDALSAHVAILDERGTILAVNEAWRAFARRNGLRMPDDGIGADYLAVCRRAAEAGDQDAVAAFAGIAQVLAGTVGGFRMAYPCHGPTERNWFLLNATNFVQDGRLFVVLAHENITEQQLAEEATRDREQRFKALLEALPDPLLIIDRAGTIVQVNAQAERSFGYSRDELVGRSVETLIPARRLGAHRRAFPDYFAGPGARPLSPGLDLNARRKDGSEFPIEITISPLDTPDGVRLIANVRDATARRQADLDTARLAAIVKSSDDSILSVSLDGRLLSWNDASERLYGYTAEEAVGRPIEDVLPIEGPERWSECLHSVRRGEAIVACETAIRARDGSRLQMAVTVSPLRDPQGHVRGASVVAKDITRLKAALQESAHHTAELEALRETNKLKDHFLSTISHEMKTPLSLINGYAELLEDVCQEKAWLAGIQEGSRRLTAHLNDVLDYTALLSGTLPIDKTECAPGELVRQVVDAAEPAFAEKGVALAVAIAPDLPAVGVDARRLVQMLTQLLDNARKFTPPGGRVELAVRADGPTLRFAVRDTGVGIPAQDRDRIWAAFTQLDIGDALRKGGLGLGLTLVMKLAELHGGHVELESDVGRGSVFTLVLPI